MGKHNSKQITELVISYHQEKMSMREIGKTLKIPYSTVKYMIDKHNKTGLIGRKEGGGRKQKLSRLVKNTIVKMVEENPKIKATEIVNYLEENSKINVVSRTIRNFLKSVGYENRIACPKPLLRSQNVEKRLKFAENYILEPNKFWDEVIFSDETKFNLFGNDGQVKVWRKRGKRFDEKNLSPTVKFNGGCLMCWGCFSSSGVGDLYFIEGIMDKFKYIEILKTALKSSAGKLMKEAFIFQQDNDPKHTSKLVSEYFSKGNIEVLSWPSQSPDLNPIENLWSYIKNKLSKKRKTKEELKGEILRIWNSIPVEFCKKLVSSMPKRLAEVIKANGKNTKY